MAVGVGRPQLDVGQFSLTRLGVECDSTQALVERICLNAAKASFFLSCLKSNQIEAYILSSTLFREKHFFGRNFFKKCPRDL